MYNLIIGRNTSELALKVNEQIREGFMPLGGPVMIEGDLLVQAILKVEKAVEKKTPYDYRVRGAGLNDYEANR